MRRSKGLSIIIGFAVSVLVFGGLIFVRPRLTPARYPHRHLQTLALEPGVELTTVDYKLPKGKTLNEVARLRYGHQSYYRIIKLYNHLEDEGQVTADYNLRLPDMSVILSEEGVTRVAAPEVALILCSRAKYDQVV